MISKGLFLHILFYITARQLTNFRENRLAEQCFCGKLLWLSILAINLIVANITHFEVSP